MTYRHAWDRRRVVVMVFLLGSLSGFRPAHAAEAAEAPRVVAATAETLEAGFDNPPAAARPAGYWAWLNGHVDRDQLGWELDEWKAKGMSKAYIFECGARDPLGLVPAGPAFMSPESVRTIAHAVREAGRAGMELGFTTSSSWNAGGSWVTPEDASMGLFHARVEVQGPQRFDAQLPFPAVPARAPKRPDGRPAFYRDVAVLAVPEAKTLPGFEFIIELPPPGPHQIERVVLYNTESGEPDRYGPLHLFAKDFTVAASVRGPWADSFRDVVRDTLQPHTDAQEFTFEATPARFVRLTLHNGHNLRFDKIQLGEFEAYSTDGRNVALQYKSDGTGGNAKLLHYTSALAERGNWSADKIYDGQTAGAAGSWSSGEPTRWIEDPAVILDLTERIDDDGRLQWDVPPGRWTLERFVCSNTGQGLAIPSPQSQGLAIDHFSASATRKHFEFLIDALQAELGPLRESALTTMYLCSYELRGAAWTPAFLDEFRQRRGYDMRPYLPVLFGAKVGDDQVSERFRYDYRKTQGDLLVDAFYKTAAQVSHEHGLLLCAEAGGPGPPTHNVPVDALKAQGAIDIPRGEFWTDLHLWVVKETACAAHIYGKPIVDMEAFTGWGHWQDGPFDLKPFADRAMCEGTNFFTFHTSPHRPRDAGYPGWVYHAGTHIAPGIAWWPHARGFIDYLARCCYLLQQGLFVADVCYYYGDEGYNFVPPKHIDPSLGYGFDYDVTNAEVLLTRMSVRDGRVTLPDGMSYQVLVLPERDDIDLQVLQKLKQLIRNGATVIGPRPTRSNGLFEYRRQDAEVRRLADEIWGPCDGRTVQEHPYGRGRVIWGRTIREVLRQLGSGPDFQFIGMDEHTDLDFVHRRTDQEDVYFVSNRNDRWETVSCVFRVTGKAPEIWQPGDGQRIRPAVFRTGSEGTEVPLRLAPHGAVFVVFREPVATEPIERISRRPGPAGSEPAEADGTAIEPWLPEIEATIDGKGYRLQTARGGLYEVVTASGKRSQLDLLPPPAAQQLDGPWQVSFPPNWGAPESVQFDRLICWTQHAEQGIKYFSGSATYEICFDVPPETRSDDLQVLLDLGRVSKVATVQLNGQPLGIVWQVPCVLDATPALRSGENHLTVTVANTWNNRLVGDAQLPEDQRFCQTNMQQSRTWRMPWKDTPLIESGLLGPVQLVWVRQLRVPESGQETR
jgi:hypothetical protein